MVVIDPMTISSVKFSVSYNTHYNVSIVATSICGQNRIVANLHYGELLLLIMHTHWVAKLSFFVAACNYSRLQEGNTVVRIINYSRPALEGTSIMFDCPPGLELTGSESSTCTENGDWTPDPRNITCSRSKSDKSMINMIV